MQSWRDELPLYVLPSGPNPPNPSELLGSAADGRPGAARCESEVDVVLFDAPPLLPVTDAAVLGRHVCGALLVTRAGSTKLDHLKQAAEVLRSVDVRILGTVLNRKPRRGKGSSYDSYAHLPLPVDDVPASKGARAAPAGATGAAGASASWPAPAADLRVPRNQERRVVCIAGGSAFCCVSRFSGPTSVASSRASVLRNALMRLP